MRFGNSFRYVNGNYNVSTFQMQYGKRKIEFGNEAGSFTECFYISGSV